jgi:amidase
MKHRLLSVLSLGVALHSSSAFDLQEATVQKINAAFSQGTLTSHALVSMYLARIEQYDSQGPTLESLINVNPDALQIAQALDEERKVSGPRSPLHGIPVILKDNFNTNDMPTTGASIAFKDLRPAKESFVVQKLRAAGAIILAKSTLTELVRASLTPSIGGQAKNPYDLTRNPGQSSAGTGAALAANFAPLGLGTDNGQSVRSPASACSLFGLKPTSGLVSNAGVLPSSLSHNSCGPMTRSVIDMAYLLNVMAGFDPDDPITRFAIGHVESNYEQHLDSNGLRGARLGLVTQVMGNQAEHAEVNTVVRAATDRMEQLGATVIPVYIPGLLDYRGGGSDVYEAWDLLNQWFADLGPTAPYTDIDDFLLRAEYDKSIVPRLMEQKEKAKPEYLPEYEQTLIRMTRFRQLIVEFMDRNGLDALVYPLQSILVTKHGQPNSQRNGFIASVAMLPAINVPVGYSQPTSEAPVGVPIGLDILGRPFDEGRLLKLAYAWEMHGWQRKVAPFAP